MRFGHSAIVLLASAVFSATALAQDSNQSKDPPDGKRIRQQVNLRMEEWFDEERADGVTDASHPYTLLAPNFTYDGTCHWRRREKDRTPPFPTVVNDQDEEQEDRDRPSDLTPTSTPSIPFRNGGAGGKIQFATALGIPAFTAVSPTDSIGVEFDEIQTDTMPGLFLSTTLAFGTFEMTLFADYVAGSFEGETKESQRTIEYMIDLGHGGPELVTEVVTDRFALAGKLWMMQIGVAPILKRFATEDGLFSAEISIAAGGYFGERTDTVVSRSGAVTESLPVSSESLAGFFAGPTIHATLRVAGSLRVGAFGEFWRLMGAANGWTGLAGLEVRIEF